MCITATSTAISVDIDPLSRQERMLQQLTKDVNTVESTLKKKVKRLMDIIDG